MDIKIHGTIRIREISEVYKLIPKGNNFRARDISMNPRIWRIIANMAQRNILKIVGTDRSTKGGTTRYIYTANPDYNQVFIRGRKW